MRIVVVSAGPFLGQIGGGQRYVQLLAHGLSLRGHLVTVVSPTEARSGCEPTMDDGTWMGISVVRFPTSIEGETLSERISEIGEKRIELARKLLVRLQPEFVHINGLMPPMVAACNRLGLHYLVVAHHPGEVCPKGDLLTPADLPCAVVPSPTLCGSCTLRCKKRGVVVGPIVAMIPANLLRSVGRWLSQYRAVGYIGRVLLIPWAIEQRLNGLRSYLTAARLLVAPSRSMASALERAGVDPSRIRTIAHGITGGLPTPILGLGERRMRFAYVGRIDHAKGVHVLLAAMRLADIGDIAELHIYGEPTNPRDAARWKKTIRKFLNEPWLYIHGSFTHAESAKIYDRIDVLVLPSICPESFGLVVAESLMAGRPVLTTDCGGPSEQVSSSRKGWIVPTNDPITLAAMLGRLARNPEEVVATATFAGSIVKTQAIYLDEIEAELASSKI